MISDHGGAYKEVARLSTRLHPFPTPRKDYFRENNISIAINHQIISLPHNKQHTQQPCLSSVLPVILSPSPCRLRSPVVTASSTARSSPSPPSPPPPTTRRPPLAAAASSTAAPRPLLLPAAPCPAALCPRAAAPTTTATAAACPAVPPVVEGACSAVSSDGIAVIWTRASSLRGSA